MLFVGSIARFTLHIARQQGGGDDCEQEYGFEVLASRAWLVAGQVVGRCCVAPGASTTLELSLMPVACGYLQLPTAVVTCAAVNGGERVVVARSHTMERIMVAPLPEQCSISMRQIE